MRLMFKKPIPKISTIGGGTGSFVVLSGLKNFPVELYAIVSMMDSGGSTGKLRGQLGVLPPGDLRQALVALSESEDIWRTLFTYRYDNGDLSGHNFGNILLSTLERITGSNKDAVNYAMRILQTRGEVIPVTFSDCTLCAEYEDGNIVMGESIIDNNVYSQSRIKRVYLSPGALINIDAKRILERSDFIIIGPGDLYTSIFPNLVVEGMKDTLSGVTAKKIFISNLMSKKGQTDNFKLTDFLEEIEKYAGENILDYVLINSVKPDPDILKIYQEKEGSCMIEDNVKGKYFKKTRIIRADLISREKIQQNPSDQVKRSLIRHDPRKTAESIYRIIDSRSLF